MPINSLQQSAFNATETFKQQVIAEVKKQALKYSAALPNNDPNQAFLSQVIKYPEQPQFASTMVSDYNWTVTYTAWAENPASADGAIQTYVEKLFGLLTGYYPPGQQTMSAPESAPEPNP